jgi:hypothetical protein
MANFLNINGLNIHYKWINHQKETTFVFINSLGTDFRIWDKVVEGLVDVANVLCYDKWAWTIANGNYYTWHAKLL